MGDAIGGHAQPDPNVYIPSEPPQAGFPTGAFDYTIDTRDQSAPATGGGYTYDPDTLNSLAADWEHHALEYREDLRYANVIAAAEGPGLEYASVNNAEKVRDSGEALASALRNRVEYCLAQAEKCRQAAGKYAKAEDDHAIGKTSGWLRDISTGETGGTV